MNPRWFGPRPRWGMITMGISTSDTAGEPARLAEPARRARNPPASVRERSSRAPSLSKSTMVAGRSRRLTGRATVRPAGADVEMINKGTWTSCAYRLKP